jgi:hypothetical protein
MNTKLDLFRKPVTAFNPENKLHRKYWAMFMRDQSWINIPVRFVLSDNAQDLVSMINKQLSDYYINKEFKSVVNPPQEPVAKKQQKTSKKSTKKS